MGNKSDINIDIFANANLENEFIVRTTFSSEMLNQSFSYETTISLWTYNKIKEMML